MSEPVESSGLITSLRHVFATLFGMVGNRLELFVVELQEERDRLLEVITLVLLVIFFGGFSLALVTASLVYLLWPTHPLFALLGVAALYAVAAGMLWTRVQALLRDNEPFSATLAEFKKDQKCLRPAAEPPASSASNSSSSRAN
jgi:uncharacterized membrane protein YqjE